MAPTRGAQEGAKIPLSPSSSRRGLAQKRNSYLGHPGSTAGALAPSPIPIPFLAVVPDPAAFLVPDLVPVVFLVLSPSAHPSQATKPQPLPLS